MTTVDHGRVINGTATNVTLHRPYRDRRAWPVTFVLIVLPLLFGAAFVAGRLI